jgi:GR25 family glycosyltransferase involved in LPS biosynthesis
MKCRIIRIADHEFSSRIADDCIQQARKFGLDVQPFDALRPEQAQDLFDSLKIKKYPARLKKDHPGVMGCAGSHFSLWQQCVEDGEDYLVLEQDGYMVRPLPDLQFDEVLKLDSGNPFSDLYDQWVTRSGDQMIEDYDLSWGYKKKAAPYGGYFRGAWAYIIRPSAAAKLVDAFKTNGWVPADKQFGQQLLHLQTVRYTVFRIHPAYNSENIEDLSLTRNL